MLDDHLADDEDRTDTAAAPFYWDEPCAALRAAFADDAPAPPQPAPPRLTCPECGEEVCLCEQRFEDPFAVDWSAPEVEVGGYEYHLPGGRAL